MTNYLSTWKKTFKLEGRALRSEYWLFSILTLLLFMGMSLIERFLFDIPKEELGIIATMFYLASTIPSFSLSIRRLHDVGKSGYWCFINLIPLFGGLYFFYLVGFKSGDEETNSYGNPV